MRMIIIYALAKRDQISGSGRVWWWSGGAFLAYNIGILNREATHMIFLTVAILFSIPAIGWLFAGYMARKIPSAPRDQKSGSGRS